MPKKKLITGSIVVKSIKEELKSISQGNKTELKVRFAGSLKENGGKQNLADIESFVIKGDPVLVRELMSTLNLDTIDETTTLSINENLQTRLDES